MINRKRRFLAGAVVLLLTLVGYMYLTRDNDPLFKGKPLSVHLAAIDNFADGPSMANRIPPPFSIPIEPGARFSYNGASQEAISSVGANALPMLARMLGSRDTEIGLWLEEYASTRPFLKKLVPTDRTKTWVRQMQATAAFHELGPRASPAIPAIIRLLDNPQCAMCAMISLTYIRPTAKSDIMALTNVLMITTGTRDGFTPEMFHTGAILALGSFGTNASRAVPLLLTKITSTNEDIQAACAVALARIGAPPELAVPKILATIPLGTSSASVFTAGRGVVGAAGNVHPTLMKIWALEQYGRHASNALPVFIRIEQTTRIANFKDAARHAIKAITADMESGKTNEMPVRPGSA